MATHLFNIWSSTTVTKDKAHTLCDALNQGCKNINDRAMVIEFDKLFFSIAGNVIAKRRADKILAQLKEYNESKERSQA